MATQRVIKVEKFFVDEPRLWRTLKATRYYHNLSQCVAGDRALPFQDWLKVMLHIPSSLSISELVRIYDEEDTMTILATVRSVAVRLQAPCQPTCSHNACSRPPLTSSLCTNTTSHRGRRYKRCTSLSAAQMVKPEEYKRFNTLMLIFCSSIHPVSRLRVQWDSFMLVVLATVCMITPFVICFDVEIPLFSTLSAPPCLYSLEDSSTDDIRYTASLAAPSDRHHRCQCCD